MALVHRRNEEEKMRTYTESEILAWTEQEKLGKAGLAAAQSAPVDPDYEAFLAWKKSRLTPNQPRVVTSEEHNTPMDIAAIECPECHQHFKDKRGLAAHARHKHSGVAAAS